MGEQVPAMSAPEDEPDTAETWVNPDDSEVDQTAEDEWAIETYVPEHLEKFKEWARGGIGSNEAIDRLGPFDIMDWLRQVESVAVAHRWAKRFIEKETIDMIAIESGRRQGAVARSISGVAQRLGSDVRLGRF